MGWSITIGRIGGTLVRLHLTFVFFLLWIGIALFLQGGVGAAMSGVTFFVLLFLCVVLHELGHALAAAHFGVRTKEIVLLPIGGVARLEHMPSRPREELLVALAGPGVTAMIAIVLLLALGGLPDPMQVASGGSVNALLGQLAYANLGLLVFNLLPAFPLDGGRVLRALLSARLGHLRATAFAARTGQAAAIVLGLVGLIAGHVLLALVAGFVFIAAWMESWIADLRDMAETLPVDEVMITEFRSLPPDAPISDAAEAVIRTSQHDFPIVSSDGKLQGILTRDVIIEALARKAAGTAVEEIMVTDVPSVQPNRRLDHACDLIEAGAPVVAVIGHDGKLVGLVTRENLLEQMLMSRARMAHVLSVEKTFVTAAAARTTS